MYTAACAPAAESSPINRLEPLQIGTFLEPETVFVVADSPAIGAPFGNDSEPPGIGPNRGVFGSGPTRAEKRQCAGEKRRTTPNQVLFAMQTVVGSSPISRFVE
jgi:hypothetical protein